MFVSSDRLIENVFRGNTIRESARTMNFQTVGVNIYKNIASCSISPVNQSVYYQFSYHFNRKEWNVFTEHAF